MSPDNTVLPDLSVFTQVLQTDCISTLDKDKQRDDTLVTQFTFLSVYKKEKAVCLTQEWVTFDIPASTH